VSTGPNAFLIALARAARGGLCLNSRLERLFASLARFVPHDAARVEVSGQTPGEPTIAWGPVPLQALDAEAELRMAGACRSVRS